MDCHLHTVASGDSVTRLEEIFPLAHACGLDVIAVTDHHTVMAAMELAARAAATESNVRIVVGEEIRTPVGEIIGLFLSQRVPYVLPLREAAARVRDQGGLIYAPHPFDQARHSLGERGLDELATHDLLDVVEGFNAKVPSPDLNEQAVAAAAHLGRPVAAGSDAHDPEGVGAAYVELDEFTDASGFLAALATAQLAGGLFPHANRYLPRTSRPLVDQ
jgi:predicted metal-dependent phosphoesterase TrpH